MFEMDPLTEIRVGSGVSIKSLVRSTDPDTPTLWYAQDANGAIWKVDVIVSHTVSGLVGAPSCGGSSLKCTVLVALLYCTLMHTHVRTYYLHADTHTDPRTYMHTFVSLCPLFLMSTVLCGCAVPSRGGPQSE